MTDAVEACKRVHQRLLNDPFGFLPTTGVSASEAWVMLAEITRLHNRVLELHAEVVALKKRKTRRRK